MTSNFTLLGMMMGMDWVIFAELACPCLSWPATTSPVEGERGRLRVLGPLGVVLIGHRVAG